MNFYLYNKCNFELSRLQFMFHLLTKITYKIVTVWMLNQNVILMSIQELNEIRDL